MLCGGYGRPIYAAELYARRVAPEIWLCRPAPHPPEDLARALGVRLPREEEVSREILLRKGVPGGAVRLYGRGVLSTVHEARSLAAEYPFRGKRILIVTSRFHARRSRMIFRDALPGAEVRVVATPYDAPAAPWWRDKFTAQSVVLEVAKTAYYLLGGAFVATGA